MVERGFSLAATYEQEMAEQVRLENRIEPVLCFPVALDKQALGCARQCKQMRSLYA